MQASKCLPSPLLKFIWHRVRRESAIRILSPFIGQPGFTPGEHSPGIQENSVAQVLGLQNGQFLKIIFLPEKIDKYQTQYFGASPHRWCAQYGPEEILDRYFPAAAAKQGVSAGSGIHETMMGDEKKKPLVVRPCFCPSERHGMTV